MKPDEGCKWPQLVTGVHEGIFCLILCIDSHKVKTQGYNHVYVSIH